MRKLHSGQKLSSKCADSGERGKCLVIISTNATGECVGLASVEFCDFGTAEVTADSSAKRQDN